MTADGPSIKAVLALKYIQPGFPMPTLYFGIANVVANGLIMLRYEYYPQTTRLSLTSSAPLSSGFLRIWKMITRII